MRDDAIYVEMRILFHVYLPKGEHKDGKLSPKCRERAILAVLEAMPEELDVYIDGKCSPPAEIYIDINEEQSVVGVESHSELEALHQDKWGDVDNNIKPCSQCNARMCRLITYEVEVPDVSQRQLPWSPIVDMYGVFCFGCHHVPPLQATKELAIALWNAEYSENNTEGNRFSEPIHIAPPIDDARKTQGEE